MWYGRLATTSYGAATRLHEVLVEGVAFDRDAATPGASGPSRFGDRQRTLEPGAQERRQATIELHGRDRGTGIEQAARQEAQAGPDLQDVAAGRRRRLGQDPVEDVDVGEEVLRQAVAGAQAGLAQRGPDDGRIQPAAWPTTAVPGSGRGAAAAGHQRIASGQ